MWMTLRPALIGACLLGGIGLVTGFVIGLNVYAPTAWAASVEVGLPATVAGALIGLVVAASYRIERRAVARLRHRSTR